MIRFLRDGWIGEAPRIEIPKQPLITAFSQTFLTFGSCFAQNIGESLSPYGFKIIHDPGINLHFSTLSMANTIERVVNQVRPAREDLYLYNNDLSNVMGPGYNYLRRIGDRAFSRGLDQEEILSGLLGVEGEEGLAFAVRLGGNGGDDLLLLAEIERRLSTDGRPGSGGVSHREAELDLLRRGWARP